MAVIIVSSSNDYHAAAASWAMQEAGLSYVLWEGAGHEVSRQATLEVSPSPKMKLGSNEVTGSDVVWYRRPRGYSYHPNMAEMDRKFVRPESIRFTESIDILFEALGCRCVNPPGAARSIARKARQLLLAHTCGFLIPRTLMSNSAPALACWMAAESSSYIYKGFQPHVWSNPANGMKAFAQTVKLPESIDDLYEQISFAPGIYQSLVKKVCDVRIVVMGSVTRAFRIVSPELDWRLEVGAGRAQAEEIELPKPILEKIHLFMRRAEIVTGSFDFAVDVDGLWWFLEVNETGQFLWIDQIIPEAGLLQDFLSFLTEQKRDKFPPLAEFTFTPTEAEPAQDPSSLITLEI